MSKHLPITLKQTFGGYAIQCGDDPRATLYLYVEHDEATVDRRHLKRAEALELATLVAKTLKEGWTD